MFHIWKLILISHRRKRHILGLILCIIAIFLCVPLINSLSLGEGLFVNNIFQHQITELIGLLFLVYFGSTSISQFNQTKITQLLRSKKKQPISFISQLRAGIYSIYVVYIISTYIITLFLGGASDMIGYSNLLVSGATILTITMMLSLVINDYSTMIGSFIVYGISYSINFILFSTPNSFKSSFSYTILTILQYLFPRFDLLYSTAGRERMWAFSGNIFYLICTYCIFIYIFLRHYNK